MQTKTTIDWRRYGPLGQISEFARSRRIEIACPYCGDEICINPTIRHKGNPQIACPGCGLTGYMAEETKSLIWFRGTTSRITNAPKTHGFPMCELLGSNGLARSRSGRQENFNEETQYGATK